MKYSEKCEHCGSLTTAYTHRLSKPLVRALSQLITYWIKKQEGANLQKDLNLTKNQYNNFQKLQYFGLIIRDEGRKPTKFGINFIKGVTKCPLVVATLGGHRIAHDHEARKTHKDEIQKVSIDEVDEEVYKKWREYADEVQR